MRILITGSRDFTDFYMAERALLDAIAPEMDYDDAWVEGYE